MRKVSQKILDIEEKMGDIFEFPERDGQVRIRLVDGEIIEGHLFGFQSHFDEECGYASILVSSPKEDYFLFSYEIDEIEEI